MPMCLSDHASPHKCRSHETTLDVSLHFLLCLKDVLFWLLTLPLGVYASHLSADVLGLETCLPFLDLCGSEDLNSSSHPHTASTLPTDFACQPNCVLHLLRFYLCEYVCGDVCACASNCLSAHLHVTGQVWTS